MREAIFAQDGWGCQHVNQETNWEVPSSPEPPNKDSTGPPAWKPTVNNGTDLWEINLRNGGQPTTQVTQKSPWGHTPSTNLGGTWGEEDDCADVNNVWTGGPVGPPTTVSISGVTPGSSNGPQWGQSGQNVCVQTAVVVPTSIAGVTTGAGLNLSGISGAGGTDGSNNGWSDQRMGTMGATCSVDLHSVDPRDSIHTVSTGDSRDLRMLDPRDPIRGDPRGISGRLNGTSEMWGQHHAIAQHQITGLSKIGVGGSSAVGVSTVTFGDASSTCPALIGGSNTTSYVASTQWGASQNSAVGPPKDIAGSMTSKSSISGSGWEEPSPPPQRRTISNYDDGTSLWNQQSRVSNCIGIAGGNGTHWKNSSDPLSSRNNLIRSAISTQTSSASIVSNVGDANAGISGNVTVTGTGSTGVTANSNNSLGIGLSETHTHKHDNGSWPHPAGPPNVSTTVVVTKRNTGGWVNMENQSANVCVGSGGVNGNSVSTWCEDKTNPAVSNIGHSGSSWNESPNSLTWNKSNQTKLGVATSSTGWTTSGSSVGCTADSNDLNRSDWTANTHNTIISKTQQPQQKLGGGAAVNLSGSNSDLLKQSKQLRMLAESGFKKEDIERSLIPNNMNYDKATEMLKSNLTSTNSCVGGNMDNWRRHDENLNSFVDQNTAVATTSGSFSNRFSTGVTQPALQFPSSNLLSVMSDGSVGGSSGNNSQLSNVNSMQPLQVQKYLNQAVNVAGPQTVNTTLTFGQGSNVAVAAVNTAVVNATTISNSTNQPSTQQLRMLVQQIQLAVHSGYLSSQILNQPLAPTTLLLLNQLLSNIKHLQGAQQSLARNGNNGNTLLAIAKYKQQIQNLQNQINAQQTIYIKQQQTLHPSPHPAATHISSSNNEFIRIHDGMSSLQGNFSEINLKKSSGCQIGSNQQSRLNQWKFPVLDKDVAANSTDFSRAPGAVKQISSLTATNTSNVGSLGLQCNGTWSSGRNKNDGWPDSVNDNESKDWSVGQPTVYTDLVQEFEPGKPWKGSQIKSIEEDPSITPGSVSRSPLSINPTPKDANMFSNAPSKNSPTDVPSLGLSSSSTWSFNSSSGSQNFPGWSDNTQQELWSSMNKTTRGPPPELGINKSCGSGASVHNVANSDGANGWVGAARNNAWSASNSGWNSNWLLLKNLTAQIDSSTLRTLCMQHGPLLNFHLYLNQGIALCKYATCEEASKAQMTLKNCFLGNTTIIAESPSENEAHSILNHLAQQNDNPTAIQQQVQQSQTKSHNNSSAVNNKGVVGDEGSNSNTNTNNVSNINNPAVPQNSSTTSGNVSAINQQCNNPANNTSNINSANSGTNNINSPQNGNQPSTHNLYPNTNIQSTSNDATNSNAITNNPLNAKTNTVWRSSTQQSQLNINSQTRHSGGRDDFEFISKYVCSIVDD